MYIREDLDHKYEKYVLSHELEHAILHTDIEALKTEIGKI